MVDAVPATVGTNNIKYDNNIDKNEKEGGGGEEGRIL